MKLLELLKKAWDLIYIPIYTVLYWSIWEHIKPGKLKHYYQRAKYGYSDQDCWSIDWHLADIIPKMIAQLRRNLHGCPNDIADKWAKEDKDDENMTYAMKDWDTKLAKIQKAFELEYEIINHTLYDCPDNKSKAKMKTLMANKPYFEGCRIMTQKEKQLRDKGWKLFRLHFYNLWD